MSKVRERILEAASRLFYRRGIQAVGVDAIITEAAVARMSFYRHFHSKEGLVRASLAHRDEAFRTWFETEVHRVAPDPRDRPLAVFDVLALRFASQDYRGCGFLNTMAETPDREDPVHQCAAHHKARFQDYLAQLLKGAGMNPDLASELLLLFDGAGVTAVREGSVAPAFKAKRLAALLLESAGIPGKNAPGDPHPYPPT